LQIGSVWVWLLFLLLAFAGIAKSARRRIGTNRSPSPRRPTWPQTNTLSFSQADLILQASRSDVLKNPKAKHVDALREYAFRAAVDHSHEFFSGKSTTAQASGSVKGVITGVMGTAAADDDEEDDQEDDHEGGEAGGGGPKAAAANAHAANGSTKAFEKFTKETKVLVARLGKAVAEGEAVLDDKPTSDAKDGTEKLVRDAYTDALFFRVNLGKLILG
jgi:hypothetical protein